MDVIITKVDGSISTWVGLDTTKTLYVGDQTKAYDSVYFARQLDKMKTQHKPARMLGIEGEPLIAYYKDSFILTQLRFFPYIQLGVVGRTRSSLGWYGKRNSSSIRHPNFFVNGLGRVNEI